MIISVVVITYNQARYIRQAIDSILMQHRRTFDLEILVGDDASGDGTPNILLEYQKKHPDLFRLFLHEENVGATKNSYELFMAARGDYIAILEGDDYWTDPDKIQKQVDFLEQHAEYAACCCDFEVVDEDGDIVTGGRGFQYLRCDLYPNQQLYTIEDWNAGHLPSQASTLVMRNFFRNGVKGEIIYQAHRIVGDFTVAMLLVSQGNIYRMPEKMISYRRAIKKGGDSWTSNTLTFPLHNCEQFLYYCRLEKYAKKVLNQKMEQKRLKKARLFELMECNQGRKTRALRKSVQMMLKATSHPFQYVWFCIKACYLRRIPPSVRCVYAYDKQKSIPDYVQITWKRFRTETKDMRIFLYGAGGGCCDFMMEYYWDIPIEACLDSDPKKENTLWYGYRVCSPDILANYDPENIAVIITTGLYTAEIAARLQARGIRRIYSYPEMESHRAYCFVFRHMRDKTFLQ